VELEPAPAKTFDPFPGKFDHELDHPAMFRVAERGGFTRGSAGNDGRSAAVDLKLNQFR
jgi:hypothetical protein